LIPWACAGRQQKGAGGHCKTIAAAGQNAMDTEEEKPKGFKVDDRRRFSAEGELKAEHRGEDQSVQESGARAGAGAGESGAGERAPGSESTAAPDRTQSDAGGRGAAEITFETFVVGLSTQALMHLGEIPDPQSGEAAADLIAAQQLIDIIGMLHEKTRGNLDQAEQNLMNAILFELRMKYVERARRGSNPA
jgi:hypothetical protein